MSDVKCTGCGAEIDDEDESANGFCVDCLGARGPAGGPVMGTQLSAELAVLEAAAAAGADVAAVAGELDKFRTFNAQEHAQHLGKCQSCGCRHAPALLDAESVSFDENENPMLECVNTWCEGIVGWPHGAKDALWFFRDPEAYAAAVARAHAELAAAGADQNGQSGTSASADEPGK